MLLTETNFSHTLFVFGSVFWQVEDEAKGSEGLQKFLHDNAAYPLWVWIKSRLHIDFFICWLLQLVSELQHLIL